ncbi:MAG: chorismate synthase [Clostridiales Family XIII bacterium]|jgi:chorismate synthase|nr:chorismate synthase [Clostridiales Family XIII bacterium]
MNVWGNNIKLSVFGESHGIAIGMAVDGLPAGESIDVNEIRREMMRRAPGHDPFSSARHETDDVEILSGMKDGFTTGAPVCGLIRNRDARSGDYDGTLRPGHADWSALLKYGGYADMRGGGHFSGRLTALLVFAGAMAKQVLRRRRVNIYGRIAAIGGAVDADSPRDEEDWRSFSSSRFPASREAAASMSRAMETARADKDSVGGVVEAVAYGVPGGVGEPFFASLESIAASMLFSIPAVKGVEFGAGFRLADIRGSESNDAIVIKDGAISSPTNNCGGILGGISNGMPIVVRAAFKPTPSIEKSQRTVDPADMTEKNTEIKGRHDACIVPRAVPVVEAGLALSVLDCMSAGRGFLPA